MSEILSNLAQDCHRILSEAPGPDGREKIAELLQNLLSDPANVETLVPLTTGERDLLYQDAELGFCILAHNYDSPKHHHRMIMGRHGRFTPKRAAKPKCAIMTKSKMPAPKKQARCKYHAPIA